MLKRQQAESIKNVTVEDPFWTPLQNLVMDVVIPYQKAILEDAVPGAEKSHAIENFRIAAGESRGEFYGMVFQDSDVAKWLEAAAYSLVLRPDAELERQADELIALIGRAQQPDGYLDTYFIVKEPEHKWQNLEECHELYCAGHMIEAGVAYYEATGKTALLDIVRKNADLICARFGKGEGRCAACRATRRSNWRCCGCTTRPAKSAISRRRAISWRSGAPSPTILPRNARASAGGTLAPAAATGTMPRSTRRSSSRPRRSATACGPGTCTRLWPTWRPKPATKNCSPPAARCGATSCSKRCTSPAASAPPCTARRSRPGTSCPTTLSTPRPAPRRP